MPTPYALHRLARAGSTQDAAREGFTAGMPVLVVADRQEAGRGRSGRRWLEADRGLYASLAFVPASDPADWPIVPLLAGLAARDALGGAPRLKWPNDLVDGAGRKLGGILAEAAGGVVVVGLGVNLWWEAPAVGAASLHDEDPGMDAAVAIAGRWAELLLGLAEDPGDWRAEYAASCATLGKEITWVGGPAPGRGTAVAVGIDGALQADTVNGRVRLLSGEVREVRAATLGRRPP